MTYSIVRCDLSTMNTLTDSCLYYCSVNLVCRRDLVTMF